MDLSLTFIMIVGIYCSITKVTNKEVGMKIAKSLKSLKARDKNCRIVRRKGRVLVINKVNKRFKSKQA